MILKTPARGTFNSNVCSNIAQFLVNILVGFWFTAYLIKALGPSVYGLVPLAMSITSYFAVLTLALNTSIGRMLTIALEAENDDKAQRVFNTALTSAILLATVILIPILLMSWYAPLIINAPNGLEGQAKGLFLATGVAFLLNSIAAPFGAVAFCRNRIDLINILLILQTSARVLVVCVLFSIWEPNCWFVSVGILVAGFIAFSGNYGVSRYLLSQLRIDFKKFSRSIMKQMMSTGFWVSVTQLGTILILGIDLLLVNRLFGSEVAGRYSLPLLLTIYLRSAALTLAGVFTPTIIAFWGRNDEAGMINHTRRAMRFTGYTVALPVGFLVIFGGDFLGLWIDKEFTNLNTLLTLMIISLPINLGIVPMFAMNLATDRTKPPAISSIIIGVLNIPFAIFISTYCELSYYGVALSSIALLSLKNLTFLPWFTFKIVRSSIVPIYLDLFKILFATIICIVISLLISTIIQASSWLHFFSIGLFVVIAYVVTTYFVLLERVEKNDIHTRAKKLYNLIVLKL